MGPVANTATLLRFVQGTCTAVAACLPIARRLALYSAFLFRSRATLACQTLKSDFTEAHWPPTVARGAIYPLTWQTLCAILRRNDNTLNTANP